MFTKFARSNGAGGSGALDCFAAAARAAPMRLGRAEAIRFAVEEFTAVRTLGARMQVGDERFDSDEICQLFCAALGRALRRRMRVAIIRFGATCPVKRIGNVRLRRGIGIRG